jgi:hypothetical protein
MAIKRKKTVKKAARVKTKMVPSKKKNPKGLSFDVISKRKPSKKVVKKVVKESLAKKSKARAAAKAAAKKAKTTKAHEVGTLPPVYVYPPKRKIPKDVTKRIPKTVPKRKAKPPKRSPDVMTVPKSRSRFGLNMLSGLPLGGLLGTGAKKLVQSKRAQTKRAARKPKKRMY